MSIHIIDVQEVQKAFSPAQEIQTPELFVGRRDEVKAGMLALSNPGSLICIFGVRGVGKSSIANQLKLIAQGNTEVPKMLDLRQYIPKRGFNYLVQYIRCDDYVQSIGDLVKRILFGDDRNPSLLSLTSSGEHRLTSYKKVLSSEAEASISALFGAKLGRSGVRESTYTEYISDDQIQQFRRVLGTVQKDNQQKTGLLILIDEFDPIPDKRRFSSLVKACSSDFVKFGVVGIANSITELIEDHESVGRQIDNVYVERMPIYDLMRILERGQYQVRNAITFDDAAKYGIAERAEGFPYFVHLFGRESMLLALETRRTVVDSEILEVLARNITEGRLACIYEDIYQKVVRNSPQRELALKAFADIADDEIPAKAVHKTLKDMGIAKPYRLTTELSSGKTSQPILVKVRQDYYRFSDPVFKVYARIRNWKF